MFAYLVLENIVQNQLASKNLRHHDFVLTPKTVLVLHWEVPESLTYATGYY